MNTETLHPVQRLIAVLTLTALAALGVIVTASPAGAAPLFQLPFPCGETWRAATYTNHGSAHRQGVNAIDLNNDRGDSWERGRPVLASAAGRVVRSFWEPTMSGNTIEIDHGGGWLTVYAHLDSRAVSAGQEVSAGQQIGAVGGTPRWRVHLHFEQVLNNVVQPASFDGRPITYSFVYNGNPVTSRNCGANTTPTPQPAPPTTTSSDVVTYHTTATANLRTGPGTGYAVTRVIPAGTAFTVQCFARGTAFGGGTLWARSPGGEWIHYALLNSPNFNQPSPPYRAC